MVSLAIDHACCLCMAFCTNMEHEECDVTKVKAATVLNWC